MPIKKCDTSFRKVKYKNHMIIKIDADKEFGEIQYPYIINI